MKNIIHKKIIIISDIEGSSLCNSYEASAFLTDEWPMACYGMTLDIKVLTDKLLKEGVESIIVKDFHRTGYNLLPELLDPRVKLVSGYIKGPVPGLGDPKDSTALMMVGMHGSSGSDAFLAHTLTSRIKKLEVNGKLVSEAELFSSSLSSYKIKPIFFSGSPIACKQAEEALNNITTFSIEKNSKFNPETWRKLMAQKAVESLNNTRTLPYIPEGPFNATITIRDGAAAAKKMAAKWKFDYSQDKIFLSSEKIDELYFNLIRICYLSPVIEKILTPGLAIYNFIGRYGRFRARQFLKKSIPNVSTF
jgi:D-amino peptidase